MTSHNLAELLDLTSPATRARSGADNVIPVLEPLAPLLPHGGVAKGSAVEVTDTGLMLAMAAGLAQHRPNTWVAAINLPDLGLQAAAGYGVPIERLAVVDDPREHFAEVIAALAPAFPVLLVRPPMELPQRTVTRLAAHLRRTGAVLLACGGRWPGAQYRLSVSASSWSGLGSGHGILMSRQVTVRSSGRGLPPRTAELLLPNGTGGISTAEAGIGRPSNATPIDQRAVVR